MRSPQQNSAQKRQEQLSRYERLRERVQLTRFHAQDALKRLGALRERAEELRAIARKLRGVE